MWLIDYVSCVFGCLVLCVFGWMVCLVLCVHVVWWFACFRLVGCFHVASPCCKLFGSLFGRSVLQGKSSIKLLAPLSLVPQAGSSRQKIAGNWEAEETQGKPLGNPTPLFGCFFF